MKKTFKILACLLGWLTLTVAGRAQNLCVDTATTNYQCLYSGTTNTLGVLSYTNLDVCIGETIIPPTATDTTFSNGSYQEYIEHTCTNYLNSYSTNDVTYVDGWMSNGVYVATNVYFVPPIPASLDSVTNFQCLAEVDGVDVQGHCTNIIGIVLGTVTITSYGPPSVSVLPTNQTVDLGSDATFTATASGRSPFSFQWLFNATNVIPDATNQSLLLTNVQLSQAGTYTVTVSNSCGSVTNSNAVLTVIIPTCVTPPSGLVAWWQFQTNLLDYASNYNGTASGVTYTNGEVNRAIYFDGTTNSSVTFGTNVANFGTNDFAVEFWINTTSTASLQACLEKRGICNAGHFWDIRIGTCAGCTNSGAGHIIFELYGCPDYNACGNWLGVTAPTVINDGVWHHVACVRTGSNSLVYVDGKLDVSGVDPVGVADVSNTSEFRAGQNICQCCDGTVPFHGSLDELTLYNRALTTNEIQAIYNAGTEGKCSLPQLSIDAQPDDVEITYGQSARFCVHVAGTDSDIKNTSSSVLYQWQRNGTNIIGATLPCYTLNRPVVSDSGSSFRVIISDGSLSLTSRVAVLTVNRAGLTVYADPKSRQYGATNPQLTWSATGFVYGETTNVLQGSPDLSTDAVIDSNVGNYPITINGGTLTSANYASVYFGSTLIVTKATLSIAAEDKSREYGMTNPTFTWFASGFVHGEDLTVVSGNPQLTTSADTNSPVASYSILANIGSLTATNYGFHLINGKLLVTKAAIAITADDKSKATGATNPPLTGTLVGVRNNDNIFGSYSTPATIWSLAGTYPIVPILNDPNNKLPNYNVNITNGTLTIADGSPIILSQSEAQKQVNLGASISLRVISAALAPVTYAWKKNGSNIVENNVTGTTSNWLTITKFTSTNAGTYTLIVSNSVGTNISSPAVLVVGDFANSCSSNLFPIAVPYSIIDNAPGTNEITLTGDSTPTSGSFLWLSWDGNGDTPTLERDLTIPGDAYNYINPSNSEDHVISINDWMRISTGVSSAVKTYLDKLTNYCTTNAIQLPIWYHDSQGTGASGAYQFYNYAVCKLVSYNLGSSTKSVTISYWGTTQCEPTGFNFSSTNCSYTENMPPVILDPGASISDFTIGTLTVRFITNGLPEDRLSITNQGTLTGQISISGTNIFYYRTDNVPTQVGNFSGGIGTDPLVIQFNDNSTVEAVTAVARNLSYLDVSENPSTAIRTVSAVLSHAGTENIQPATINIIVIPVNDPPVVSIVYPTNMATFPAGTPVTLIATVSDVDSIIPYVTFFNGANPIGTASAAGTNYVLTWTNPPLWTNTVTAVATDGVLSATSDETKVVIVPQPPQITILSPTNGEVFAAPATIRIKTEPIDPDSIVTNVDFFSGATKMASVTNAPFYLTTNLSAGTYTFGATATDSNGLSGTASPVTITVATCASATVNSFSLSSNIVIGGSSLSGTITLSAPAMTGGQVVSLACNNSSVIVPLAVIVPEGNTTAMFAVTTLVVGDTNSASITAAYHDQVPTNASLTVLPPAAASTNVFEGAVRPGFDANFVVPCPRGGQTGPCGEDGSIGPVDIGFPISFYSKDYSNLWVNMNGNLTFNGPYSEFVPEMTIQQIGQPAIAPFWADVDPRGSYDTNTFGGTMKYGTNIVDGHLAFGVTWDNVGYFPEQADLSNRFQVVLIDRSDKGVGDFDIEFNYDRIQWETGGASGGTDGFGGSSASVGFGDGQQSGFNFQGSGVTETFVDTNFVTGLVHNSYNSPILGRYVFSVPFPVNKQIVVVRDDLAQNHYTGFTTSDAQRVSNGSENAGFDLRSVSGTVLAAQIERAGQLRRNIGTHYDFELGVGSTKSSTLNSFGPVQTDAQTLPTYYSYDLAWNLPTDFFSDIGLGLDGIYNLQPMDRITSLCGNTVQLQDQPNADWPTEKNVLTFLLSANPDIPQGRCRDIVLSGVNQFDVSEFEPAFNGAWDIVFNGQVIASSGQRNGWSVENDCTVYGGINVAAPAAALPASGYEVRLASQSSRTSGFFSLVSSNTLNSAPVLLPLQISRKAVTNGVPVTVTVMLDAPATGNGAIISLKWDGAFGGTIPAYVAIPAGQRTTQFTFAGQTNAAFSNFTIKASYNGYRKSSLYIVPLFGAVPDAPTNLTVTGENGQVNLTWAPVIGAQTYNVKRSTDSGGPYVMLFEGLSTTNYVDTQVNNGTTYYYVVSAVNANGESGDSTEVNATPKIPITTTKPVISPNGGAFNDQLQVQITDATVGADIWYTVDGSIPVNNSPSLHYTAPFMVTSDGTIRARAFLSGANDSSVASASFRVFGTNPLACGTTNSDSLSFANSFSTNRGVGYFVGRYSFTAVAGEQVTISLSSTNFDTYLYLVDPNGQLLAQNDDANGSTNSQIVYNTKKAGSYYVEATSAFPVQIGSYQISLACVNTPEIGVLSGGTALLNRATLDFGVTNIGANISKIITITNLGSADLNISNLNIVPSGTFTVNPGSVSPISPAHAADLTLTFNASTQGQYNSAFSIVNNDDDGRDGIANPVIINLTGHANLSGTAPTITIAAPSASTAPAQVTISASVTQGTSAISNVVFYLRTAMGTTSIGAAVTAPYSMTWSNVAGGNYIIYGVVTDVDGRVAVSSDVTFFVNSPPVAAADSATVTINSTSNVIQVLSNDSDPDGDTLAITGNTSPSHGTVTLIGSTYYYTPTADYVGTDSFTYTLSDGHGGTAIATVTLKVPPSTLPAAPIAQITSPLSNDRITAPTTVIGTAQSAYLDSYKLQIRPAGQIATPWKTFVTGATVVNGGSLGVLDPTLMLNGSYDIQLVVDDLSGQETASDIVTIAITGSMKVGAFAISFPDLQIPVGGLPISLTRTYDSRNQNSGDFGASWTLDVNSVHLDKNMSLGENWIGQTGGGFVPEYYLDDNGPHLITVTFPDGTVERFQPVPLFSSGDSSVPFTPEDQYIHFSFQPLPGTHGTLSATALNDLVIPVGPSGDYSGEVTINEDGSGYGDGPIFDASGFTYTTLDGRAFQFNASGKIVKMSDLNGNTLTFNNDGIVHSSGKSVKFVRDAVNRITSIYDPNGLDSTGTPVGLPVLIYKYDDPLGNLISASQLTDRNAGTYVTTTFSYTNVNFPHYLTDIHDPRGVTVSRQLYDDSGRLIGTVDSAGNTNLFSYDLNAHTATTSDALGNAFISTYDSHGNVTNTIDALHRQTSQTFDDDDNLTSTTDALHHTTYYTYDPQGNQTSVIDALGNTNLMGYDNNNNLTAVTNALRNVTQFQYDSHGNQTNIIDALGHSAQAVYDTNGNSISVTDTSGHVTATGGYDASGYLTNVTQVASGVTTAFAHDANGNQTATTNVWINPDNSADVRNVISQSVFDAQNRETTKTDPDGSQSTVSYDPDGRQSQVANKYNRMAYWTYDARGFLIEIGFPDGTITRMVYDAAGRVTETDKKHFQGAPVNGTRTTYDVVGQVIKLEQLSNIVIDVTADFNGIPSSSLTSFDSVIATSTYGYDLTGRQTAVTNSFGAVTRYEYDAVGHQTAIIDALTNRTDYVYDQAGHLIFTTNALQQVTQNVYDALGRRVQTIYPDNSYSGVAYDDAGRRVAQTNRLGLVTTYGYDDVSRMTNIVKPSVFDPESGAPANPKWGFTYNTYGQLKSTSDPKNHVTQFTYDQLGRVLTHTLPMSNLTASQIYDSYGRPSRQVDFKGQTNEWIYDGIGRLATNQFYAVGSGTPNVFAAYTYDSEDRQKQIVESRGTSGFTYDDQGNVTQITMPEGTLNYEYEPIGNRLVRTYTINSDLRYGYDLLGRISTVTVVKRNGASLTTPEVTTNTYTALGSLQDVYYPNGIHAAYQYDGLMNRLTNLTYTTGNNSLLAQYQYSAGVTGQWKTGVEILLQKNGYYVTNQLVWNYDNAGRLTNEACSSTLPARSYTNLYVYNLVGNRRWTTNIANTGTTVTGCSYNDNDQSLQEVTIVNGSTSGTFTNSYDQNGSLTNHSSATEHNSYSYNLQNKLATAVISRTDGGHQLSETINFTYNYSGNRVMALWSRSVDSGAAVNGTNYFLNDSKSGSGLNRVLEEFPSIGATPTASYTLGGRVLSQNKNGTNSHLLLDGHGSTRQVADVNGNIAEAYTYDAYGKGLDFTNGALNATMTGLLYSGEQLDADLQLYNLRARYYNPASGRFNQIDQFAENQTSGNNLYAYGAEDPVNNSDPTGMYEVDVHQFLTQYLADHAGYGAGAETLGLATQSLDLDNRDAMFGGVNHENMRLYHFVSKDQLASLRSEGVNGEDFDYYYGQYLHALEDTYAHCTGVGDRNWNYIGNVKWLWFFTVKDNGGEFGHGHLGHEPDHTYRDPEKGMKMAETVYSALKADQVYSWSEPAHAPDDWTHMTSDIDKFMHNRPNVYKELKFKVVYVENATFGGYNAKIKLLNTGYQLAVSYSQGNPPQFSDEKGFAPSKTVAGAVTRAYVIHGIADTVMAPFGFSL